MSNYGKYINRNTKQHYFCNKFHYCVIEEI